MDNLCKVNFTTVDELYEAISIAIEELDVPIVIPFSSNATVGSFLSDGVISGVNFGLLYITGSTMIDYFIFTTGSLYVFFGRMTDERSLSRLKQITAEMLINR